jgi:hypothetical protein
MSRSLAEIRNFMEKMGLPGRDGHALPDSPRTFPDGCHYRIEIAGVEGMASLSALVEEADRRQIPVHRAIATVGGSTYLELTELREMAMLAREAGIEIILTVGHRKGWDAGAKEMATSEGMMNGFRLRGSDNLSYWLADMARGLEAGFRGFLVYDEGLLSILGRMRQESFIPPETMFKFSVFGGCCNAAGAKLVASLGARSLNPSSDVSLAILAGLRQALEIPLDVYISVVDSFGGLFRAYEAHEIARVAAPCYFKFEPGTSEGDIYKPWVSSAWHADFMRQKVKLASIVVELVERHAPKLKLSGRRPVDLTLPRP